MCLVATHLGRFRCTFFCLKRLIVLWENVIKVELTYKLFGIVCDWEQQSLRLCLIYRVSSVYIHSIS